MNTKIWYDRSRQCIAQGSLTNSKHPDTDILGVFPTHFKRGHGPYLYVNDHERYLDFVAGLGAINLGYGNEQLENEVSKVSGFGGCISGNTQQEVITAEKIKGIFHWVERVKFVNDGTEACMSAIRMARAYTGKSLVLWEGYHGWYDEATAINSNAQGTPLGHMTIPLNICEIEQCKDIAAVIVEPVMLDDSRERIEYLKRLREAATKQGFILIFDEVITGMRYPSLSVSKHWGIYPDLLCLGKACANGYKIGIVAGNANVLDGDYFVSGTYFGHIPTLKATEACLHLTKHDAKYDVGELHEQAIALKEEFNLIEPDLIKLVGWGARMNFTGTDLNLALFRQTLAENRIFTKNTFFLNHATKHHTSELIMVTKFALEHIKAGKIGLKGPMPRKPVAQIARERQ